MAHGAHAKDDTLKIIGIWRATPIMVKHRGDGAIIEIAMHAD